MYDVIIIGGGPAGLTAGIYTARRKLNTLLLTGDIGGQITQTYEIENYPGIPNITGIDLASTMREQAEKFGVEILLNEVKSLKTLDNHFVVTTSMRSYESKAVILAFGKKPRSLDVPGEEALRGRGVSYCATCDAPFFKKKTVAVIGGGNSALDAALLCSKIATKVYLIHRGDSFRGEQYLADQLKSTDNIEIFFNTQIASINGENVVQSITTTDDRTIEVHGVIVEIGYMVDRSLVEGLIELDEKNQIVVNALQETSVPGLFAAGDLTQTPYKQIVVSAAEGAKAALSCFDYLQRLQGKRGVAADWH